MVYLSPLVITAMRIAKHGSGAAQAVPGAIGRPLWFVESPVLERNVRL